VSRKRRAARANEAARTPETAAASAPDRDSVPARAELWIVAACLLPNLGALLCGFVLDDLPLVVENEKLHALSRLREVWTSGYWPDGHGLLLYRPLTETVWAALWTLSGGRAIAFHALNLLLGAAAALLAFALLTRIAGRSTGFLGALLFALFPIHTEATTSVVGSAELLAAVLGMGAALAWFRDRRSVALLLFAAAILAKESAAAWAGVVTALALFEPRWRRPRRRLPVDGAAAAAVVGLALAARALVGGGPSFIPPVDNPSALLDAPRRILTALWVQVLYAGKTLVPLTLSADYSYKQVPLVMGLGDARAWAGLVLLCLGAFSLTRRALRAGALLWAVLFLPAANVLFPIGTLVGERLAYAPSLGLALLLGTAVAATPRPLAVVLPLALLYGGRTAVRNLDWRSADVFYPRLVETSPESAKAHYFLGTLHAARGDDPAAVAEYDRAVAIFPAYSEAFHNRGNALARLGRREEAMESYRSCLRFDPGHRGAAANLATLEAGLPLAPSRRSL
jgi:hypothetical protein